MMRSNVRWVLLVAVTLALLAPEVALALPGRLRAGPELHLPWTAGARLEWRPLRLVQPSLSVGYAPKGAVRGLRGDVPSPDALALALRITAQPIPLMGLSFNAGLRTFLAGGLSLPAFEVGIGWRLKLLGIRWMAELGALLGQGLVMPYVGLGAFWEFGKGKKKDD